MSSGCPIRPNTDWSARGLTNSGCLLNTPSPKLLSVGPGDTAFTRIRRGASSFAIYLVHVENAAFSEPYTEYPGNACDFEELVTLTMEPPSLINPRSLCVRNTGPLKLVFRILSKYPSVISSSIKGPPTPPLLIRKSKDDRPNFSVMVAFTVSTKSEKLRRSVRSSLIAAALPPHRSISATTSAARSGYEL